MAIILMQARHQCHCDGVNTTKASSRWQSQPSFPIHETGSMQPESLAETCAQKFKFPRKGLCTGPQRVCMHGRRFN